MKNEKKKFIYIYIYIYIYMCWGVARWGKSPPRVKYLNLLRLDMITDGESPSKMSERRAASCVVNPNIRGQQMHKHTRSGQIK